MWNPSDRAAVVSQYNDLRRRSKAMYAQLGEMEAHEGEDGCAISPDAISKLVDDIATNAREVEALRKVLYPTRHEIAQRQKQAQQPNQKG